jgi:hypothetical protein
MGKNLVVIGGDTGGASTAAEAKCNDPFLQHIYFNIPYAS